MSATGKGAVLCHHKYPYIYFSLDHEYPGIYSRRTKQAVGEKFFGPFVSSEAVKKSIKEIQKIDGNFTYSKKNNDSLPNQIKELRKSLDNKKQNLNKENTSQTNNSSSPIDLDNEKKPKLDNLGRAYATGRRKTSSARVYLKKGKGDISVNDRKLDEYFGRKVAQMLVMQPLVLHDLSVKIDIYIKV